MYSVLPDLSTLDIAVEPRIPEPDTRSYAAIKQARYRKRKRAKIASAMVAICTARNQRGEPCRKVGIGNPPLCSWHGGRVGSIYNRLLTESEWTREITGVAQRAEEQARIERIAAMPQGEAYLARQQAREAEAAERASADANSRAAWQKSLDESVHQLVNAVAQSQKQVADYQALLDEATATAEAYRTETHLYEIGAHPDQIRQRYG